MGYVRRWFRRFLGLERGATGVEYALVVSLVVVGSIAAIKRLETNADNYYDDTSEQIGDLPGENTPTPSNTAPGGSSTSTSIAASTTTTTAAPTSTTAAPTTSTTAAPTTTTTAPTTTTVANKSTIANMENRSGNGGSSDWDASVRVTIRDTANNANVAGAGVTVLFTASNGSTTTRNCTTLSPSGRCTVTWTVSESRTYVDATVTNVVASPTWDGASETLRVWRVNDG
jgi:Flp pilus assembly pilin Flp